MANIFDYIKWRGDLSLKQDKFNEIDNLILSRFSYFPFDKIIKKDEIIKIKELNKRFQNEDKNTMKILWKDDIDLFPAMAESERFGDMKVTRYINKIETSLEKQFSAITIFMPDDTIYISYRGTDNTVIGWKEDFNMSFKSHIASQIDAVNYLEEIAKVYPNNIRLGGHSKGGNLAVYAAIFSNPQIKNRIINVYNNDGPGFREEIVQKQDYKDIIGKVKTFIPQSSVVGRLLKHEEDNVIVKSNQKGIMQHDLYSWEIIGNQFVYLDELTNQSIYVDKTIKDWLNNVEDEKRELVIDVLFEIISSTEILNLSDFKTNIIANAKTVMMSYKKLDDETKEIITQTLQILFKMAKNNFKIKPRYKMIEHQENLGIT